MWKSTCIHCSLEFNRKYKAIARFCSDKCQLEHKANKNGDCIEWSKSLNKAGYGRIETKDYGKLLAHRAAYKVYIGDIPDGMSVCHKCDNPKCINPDHLFLGTQQDNNKDKINKNRQAKGERSGAAKLDSATIEYIRNSPKTLRELAKELSVNFSTIGYARRNHTWRHI